MVVQREDESGEGQDRQDRARTEKRCREKRGIEEKTTSEKVLRLIFPRLENVSTIIATVIFLQQAVTKIFLRTSMWLANMS